VALVRAGDHHRGAVADQRGSDGDRREAAAALAVDGQRGHGQRQARGERRHPGDVTAGAHAVAEHDLVDGRGAGGQRGEHRCREVCGVHVAKSVTGRADRGAQRVHDDRQVAGVGG